jgi:hypothetical protein
MKNKRKSRRGEEERCKEGRTKGEGKQVGTMKVGGGEE